MKREIYMLGDGPYAREVADQISRLSWGVNDWSGSVVYVASGEDSNWRFPAAYLAVGIANPAVKKEVIERSYLGLDADVYVSAISYKAAITPCAWWKCVNIGPLTTFGLNVEVCDFVSICSNVTIGHDVSIGKYSTICPGAVISGNVHIEEAVFIGTGAVIKDGVTVSANAIVGCGAVAIEDVLRYSVVAGNPAGHLRFNE